MCHYWDVSGSNVFGWPLGNPAYPVYFDELWHSRNCTFETGGKNTPCFKNAGYDALVEEFMQTGDLLRARDLVFEMQSILADQRPYIPLYSQKIYDLADHRLVFPYTEMLGGIELQDGFTNQVRIPISQE